MTSEQKQALIAQVACLEVWPTECETPLARGISGELAIGNETKFNLFKAALDKLTEAEWTYDNLIAIVARLRTLPHDDLPQLRNIRTKGDVKRLVNNPQQLKRLAHLRPESAANKEINERLQFIVKHNLTGPETTDKVAVQQTDSSEKYQEIRDHVSALTNRDCGNVYSTPGGGAWDKVNALKRRLFTYVDACEKNSVPAAMVAERVNADIETFRSTSIR